MVGRDRIPIPLSLPPLFPFVLSFPVAGRRQSVYSLVVPLLVASSVLVLFHWKY